MGVVLVGILSGDLYRAGIVNVRLCECQAGLYTCALLCLDVDTI